MATKMIAGKTVQVNEEGFMTNPSEWTKEIAVEIAKEEGIADEELRKMADRIQARAIRRCGDLLKEIEKASGARTDLQPGGGTPLRLTRKRAAAEAGMSSDQAKAAIRVSNIPHEEFETSIESDDPVFAGFVVPGATQQGPEVRFSQIFGNAASRPIVSAHGVLGNDVTLLGCLDEPAGGFGIVEFHSVTDGVVRTETKLRRWIAFFR